GAARTGQGRRRWRSGVRPLVGAAVSGEGKGRSGRRRSKAAEHGGWPAGWGSQRQSRLGPPRPPASAAADGCEQAPLLSPHRRRADLARGRADRAAPPRGRGARRAARGRAEGVVGGQSAGVRASGVASRRTGKETTVAGGADAGPCRGWRRGVGGGARGVVGRDKRG
ncbi:hypothetical protein BS78_01G409200, partial [Paspalum vaginatum]